MTPKTRQTYYKHLCSIELPEVLAASMASQVDGWGLWAKTTSKRESVSRFCIWSLTKEGHEFWYLMHESML